MVQSFEHTERQESYILEGNKASSRDQQSKKFFDKMSEADILVRGGLSLVQFFLRRHETGSPYAIRLPKWGCFHGHG